MKAKKIAGGFAWVVLAALLILINMTASDSDEVLAQSENTSIAVSVQ